MLISNALTLLVLQLPFPLDNEDQENAPPPKILPDISAYEFPRSLRSALKGLFH